MKSFLPWVLVMILTLLSQTSCNEESDCELNDYAPPEIEFLEPSDGVIVWPYQGPNPQLSLRLKAEAGLNTLMWEDPYGYPQHIKAFTGGETALDFTFELDYIYDNDPVFVLYDLCNQRVEIEASVIFEQATSN